MGWFDYVWCFDHEPAPRPEWTRHVAKWLAFGFLCACHPSPAPTPPKPDSVDPVVDGGDAALWLDGSDPCERACSNLAAIGCIEGTDPECVNACERNITTPITVQPLACWTLAGNKEAARACGGLRCP